MITYSIDKAGDGKAQAFGAWFIEYFTNIMIQPLQAILYLIFVFSANEIAQKAPIVGVIFLLYKYGLRVYKVGILNYSSSNLWKKIFNALKQRD